MNHQVVGKINQSTASKQLYHSSWRGTLKTTTFIIRGTNNYNQQKTNGKNPSILTGDPNKLLREGAGKGRSTTPTKETVDYGRVIGKYYDRESGKYYNTTRATIHYDSKGNVHIVPARPKGFK